MNKYIPGPDLQVLDQQLADILGHRLVNGYLHHRAELSPADALLHGLEQVIRLDFLYFHIGIADDAERVHRDDFHAREEQADVRGDQLFEPDEVMVDAGSCRLCASPPTSV